MIDVDRFKAINDGYATHPHPLSGSAGLITDPRGRAADFRFRQSGSGRLRSRVVRRVPGPDRVQFPRNGKLEVVELLRLDKSFVAGPDAARAARHSLEHLHEALPASTTSRLSLLVTELVANAVIHGSPKSSDPVEVRAWTSPQAILVEVTANGPGFSWVAPAPGGMAVGGWGLVLVEREADRWGIQAGPPTTVWFQINSTLPAGRESVIEQ